MCVSNTLIKVSESFAAMSIYRKRLTKFSFTDNVLKELNGTLTGVGVHNGSAIVIKTPALIEPKLKKDGRVHVST